MAGALPTWRNPTGNPFAGVSGMMNSANKSWQQGSDALTQALANPLKRQQAQEDRALENQVTQQGLDSGVLDMVNQRVINQNQQALIDLGMKKDNASISKLNSRVAVNNQNVKDSQYSAGRKKLTDERTDAQLDANKLYTESLISIQQGMPPGTPQNVLHSLAMEDVNDRHPEYSQYYGNSFDIADTTINKQTTPQKTAIANEKTLKENLATFGHLTPTIENGKVTDKGKQTYKARPLKGKGRGGVDVLTKLGEMNPAIAERNNDLTDDAYMKNASFLNKLRDDGYSMNQINSGLTAYLSVEGNDYPSLDDMDVLDKENFLLYMR